MQETLAGNARQEADQLTIELAEKNEEISALHEQIESRNRNDAEAATMLQRITVSYRNRF
jgi:hypothetical protein